MWEEYNDLIRQRIEKIEKLRSMNINPYPIRFTRDLTAADVLSKHKDETPLEGKLAGRIRSRRLMGKASFAHIEDMSGLIQLYFRQDILGEQKYEIFKLLDLGDIIGVHGKSFRTKTGEITIEVHDFTLLAKCIRPLPVVKEKDGKLFDEFADRELRYRHRYIDLIVTPKTKSDFILRSKLINGIREFLTARGFLEVETPMMQAIPGGASARPFVTHHNALNIDLYLRIAPELYLKRLLVGGFEKVFELNRNFRNEGISTRHNPEFTMLELYEAYSDYNAMMQLCEEMISSLSLKLLGTMRVEYQGERIDFTPPWKRIAYVDAIREFTDIDFRTIKSATEAYNAAKSIGIHLDEKLSKWKIAEHIFEERVEKHLIQPTFVIDYPTELSPLAKTREDDPEFVERFEPYIAGREIGNAFSELNDPFDQRRRFEEQVRMREAGDEEAQMMDYDFLMALEYGMPPAGGMGIGIDRLVMLFINTASIKDTILFPLLRPDTGEHHGTSEG
ncbi:MAG: lysine--tRNA ligase [Spirochaetes bacterium]|nr:lysine--tRNA ligase [Spirochaetota bacterium]